MSNGEKSTWKTLACRTEISLRVSSCNDPSGMAPLLAETLGWYQATLVVHSTAQLGEPGRVDISFRVVFEF